MHTLPKTPEERMNLRKKAEECELSARALKRLEWIMYYTEQAESVSDACKHFGISRSTFYRTLERYDPDNLRSLEDRPRPLPPKTAPAATADARELIRNFRKEKPSMNREQIAETLASKLGITLSSSTVGRIIRTEGLYFGSHLAHRKKRLAWEKTKRKTDGGVFLRKRTILLPVLCLMAVGISILSASSPNQELPPFHKAAGPPILEACEDVLHTYASVLQWHEEHGKRYEPTEQERTEVESCSHILDAYKNERSPLSFLREMLQQMMNLMTPEKAYAAEGINPQITFQGKITDIAGSSVTNRSFVMRFRLYDAPSGGNLLWSETWDGNSERVTMAGGLFTVALGTHTPFSTIDFNSDQLYLQTELDHDENGRFEEVFAPRDQLTAVPYAHNADTVDGLEAAQFVRSDASDVLSGSLLIHQEGRALGVADANVLLEILGTASGKHLHAQDLLTSSGQVIITATDADNLHLMELNTEETTGAQDVFRIHTDVGSDENLVFRINASGSTVAAGSFSSEGADYAEWFFSEEDLQVEEAVCLDARREKTVKRCSKKADPNIIGIVSSEPAFIGNAGGAEGHRSGQVLVGLIGQVKAKVIVENGRAIHIGDELTSAKRAGFLRKAKRGQSTVGIALQNLEGGKGTLTILLSRRGKESRRAESSLDIFRIHSDSAFGENPIFSNGPFFSAGADYAEWFFADNDLTQGELTCIDTKKANTVRRCTQEHANTIIGIVSSSPAFIGNSITGAEGLPVPGTVLVGLIGQVPAKVMVQSGASIRPGDALTAARKPGYARRALPSEPTVGIAMEGLPEGEGIVNVLISRRNQSVTVETVEQKVLESIASLELTEEIQILLAESIDTVEFGFALKEQVRQQLLALFLSQESLETQSGAVLTPFSQLLTQTLALSGVTVFSSPVQMKDSLLVDGLAHVGGPATFSGGIAVADMLRAEHLTTSGSLTVSGAARFVGDVYAEGTVHLADIVVAEALRIYGDVIIDGTLKTAALLVSTGATIEGEFILSNRQTGYAEIPKGSRSVTVFFGTDFTAEPIVTVTPMNAMDAAWWVPKSTSTDFTIHSAASLPESVTFSWHALLTHEAKTVAGDVPEEELTDFPADAQGVPVSENAVWNSCIRNQTPLDQDGQPYNCQRFHKGNTWTHPDTQIEFTWNPKRHPEVHLPEGFRIIEVELPEPEEEPETVTGSVIEGTEPDTGTGSTVIDEERGDVPDTETGSTVIDEESDVREEEGEEPPEDEASEGEQSGSEEEETEDEVPEEQTEEPKEDRIESETETGETVTSETEEEDDSAPPKLEGMPSPEQSHIEEIGE